MGISLREKISLLPLSQQKEIEERSIELIAEEKTRQQLRQLLKITQELNGQSLLEGLNHVYPIKQYVSFGLIDFARPKFIDPQMIAHEPSSDEKIIKYCPDFSKDNFLFSRKESRMGVPSFTGYFYEQTRLLRNDPLPISSVYP
jgi:hypothetical protein